MLRPLGTNISHKRTRLSARLYYELVVLDLEMYRANSTKIVSNVHLILKKGTRSDDIFLCSVDPLARYFKCLRPDTPLNSFPLLGHLLASVPHSCLEKKKA